MVIYITTNLVNGKKYIGQNCNNDPNYLGSGVNIKKAIKKYGKENFKKEILEYCSTQEELKIKEEYWLNHYDVVNSKLFYNRINKCSGYIKGKVRDEKTKNKISKSLTGKKKSQEHCLNIGKAKKGILSKRKGKPDLKQKGKPKPGAGGKGKPHVGAGPKEGNYILDIEKNIIYKSIKECMDINKISKRRMFKLLKDINGNYKYTNKKYYK